MDLAFCDGVFDAPEFVDWDIVLAAGPGVAAVGAPYVGEAGAVGAPYPLAGPLGAPYSLLGALGAPYPLAGAFGAP
jgi:hypothetical protein